MGFSYASPCTYIIVCTTRHFCRLSHKNSLASAPRHTALSFIWGFLHYRSRHQLTFHFFQFLCYLIRRKSLRIFLSFYTCLFCRSGIRFYIKPCGCITILMQNSSTCWCAKTPHPPSYPHRLLSYAQTRPSKAQIMIVFNFHIIHFSCFLGDFYVLNNRSIRT